MSNPKPSTRNSAFSLLVVELVFGLALLILGIIASAGPSPAARAAAGMERRAIVPGLVCEGCSGASAATPTNTSAPPTSTPSLPTNTPAAPTSTATAVPTPSACGGATATITGLDKVNESVSVTGSGNMTGWYLISVAGNQRYDFPSGFTLNGTVTIHSGTAQFPDTQTTLWWSASNLWNNSSDDDASLFNCNGQQVSFFDDGTP